MSKNRTRRGPSQKPKQSLLASNYYEKGFKEGYDSAVNKTMEIVVPQMNSTWEMLSASRADTANWYNKYQKARKKALKMTYKYSNSRNEFNHYISCSEYIDVLDKRKETIHDKINDREPNEFLVRYKIKNRV